jgi:tryptophan synthase alpha chain
MKLGEMFKGKKSAAFMPFVCCGDPSEEFTRKLVSVLVENGADAIELGIPFSDPIADGKTIQNASSRALKAGMNPQKALEAVRKLRKGGIKAPIIVMTYYNIVFANGMEKFVAQMHDAGADALIVPDAPPEESADLRALCKDNGVDLIYLAAPNTEDGRLKQIADASSGFLYAVSVFGTTGARAQIPAYSAEFITRAKAVCKIPVAVGFGISTPEHAVQFAKAGADGVIVASALIDLYSRFIRDGVLDEARALEAAGKFAKEVSDALGRVQKGYKPAAP